MKLWLLMKLGKISKIEYLERKNMALGAKADAIRLKRLELKEEMKKELRHG